MSTNLKILPKKNILFGIDGYIGSYLWKKYRELFSDIQGFSRRKGTIFSLDAIKDISLDRSASFAILAFGMTKVLECEKDPIQSTRVNVEKTLELISYLIDHNITPLVFSSDYVFDGKKGMYAEDARKNPLNEYGKQKDILEELIAQNFPKKCIVLRLSKVFGNPLSRCFIQEMFSTLQSNTPYYAAQDQVFTPIYVEDIFKVITYIQNNGLYGVFNLCGAKAISRYELACLLEKNFPLKKGLIKKIYLQDISENIQKPCNTSMISQRLNTQNFLQVEQYIENIMRRYEREKIMG